MQEAKFKKSLFPKENCFTLGMVKKTVTIMKLVNKKKVLVVQLVILPK